MDAARSDLASRILAVLPQTQCTRCSYADCEGYAVALAIGEAGLDQCPPGGTQGIARLAAVTGWQSKPLNPAFGTESARTVAYIDEDWCIGCTLCIKACPTDAIIGTNKRMHTVIERFCTGCELCLPVCPVDCIMLENASGAATGWEAWSATDAATARQRYTSARQRRQREDLEHQDRLVQKAQAKLADLPGQSQHTDPAVLDKKRAVIEAALERARTKHKQRV